MSNLFSWERVIEYFPKVLEKFPVTLNIVIISTLLGLILGIIIAVIRIRKIPVLHQLSLIYISFIRGTPILVQLFIVYYGMPVFVKSLTGIDVGTWEKIIYVYIAYGLNQSGFMAEIIRAAIQSVPAGQTEAAYSVGLNGVQTFRRIVFPQAVRIALPGLETMFVSLFQATALAYMLGVIDIMGKAKSIGVVTFHSLEGYVDAAIIFVITSIILEQVFHVVNKKINYGKGRKIKKLKGVRT
jgi:L-cystine transport system permease protein